MAVWKSSSPTSDLSISTTTTVVDHRATGRSPKISLTFHEFETANIEKADFVYSPDIPEQKTNNPSDSDHTQVGLSCIINLILKHLFILLCASCPLVLLGIVAATPTWTNSSSYAESHTFSHCNYDGSFTPYLHRTLSLWKVSGFFQISLFWGDMTFGLAKFIDVCFDFVIGTGLQTLLAYITYKVSSKVVYRLMESTTVSYQTFTSLAFMSPSVSRVGNLSLELLINRGIHARAIILTLIFSSLFVASLPTFTSAMSGYSTNMIAVLQDRQGLNSSWSEVEVASFIIHDGDRLGSDGPLLIRGDPSCLVPGSETLKSDHPYTLRTYSSVNVRNENETEPDETHGGNDDDNEQFWSAIRENCRPFWRTVQYIAEHGISNPTNAVSEYYLGAEEIELQAPTLNITTSYDFESLHILINSLQNTLRSNRTTISTLKLLTVNGADIRPNATFILYNETYSFEYIMTHSICEPTKSHNWGFSFLFLFITLVLLSLWSVAMYVLWLQTYLYSRVDSRGTSLGVYRASSDLVKAMEQDFGVRGVNDLMEEDQIEQVIRRRRRQGCQIEGFGPSRQDTRRFEGQQTRWEVLMLWWRGSENVRLPWGRGRSTDGEEVCR
jgi:hypothetical protein